jgi:O-antigen ligase
MNGYSSILANSKGRRYRFHEVNGVVFLALFTFPLLPLAIANALFMLFTLLTLIGWMITAKSPGRSILWNTLFILPFLPYMIEFIISGFNPVVSFEFEKKIFFFTAPLIIPLYMRISGFRNARWPFHVLASAMTLLSLWVAVRLAISGIPFQDGAYTQGAFLLRNQFEIISGIHPTYFTLMAVFASFHLWRIRKGKALLFRILLYSGILLMIALCLLLAVRIAMVAMALSILYLLFSGKSALWVKLAGTAGLLVSALLLMLLVPSLHNRFGEMSNAGTAEPAKGNTIAQRMMIMECSWKVFTAHPLWGTGSAHAQEALNDCYAGDSRNQAGQTFNAHNQFMTQAISFGIPGLLCLLLCLLFIFRRIRRQPGGMVFILIILTWFMSESVLERQMGIYFFGLSAILLYNLPLKEEKTPEITY